MSELSQNPWEEANASSGPFPEMANDAAPVVFSGLEDDSTHSNEETANQMTSYDDLRRRNREEYQNRRHGQQNRTPLSAGVHAEIPLQSPENATSPKKKNLYGDVWDE